MAVKKKAVVTIPFDAIGENLARLMDVKRRLIETSIRSGNSDYARDILDEVRDYVRCVREGLEAEYRDGSLKDMTPARHSRQYMAIRFLRTAYRRSIQNSVTESACRLVRPNYLRSIINTPLTRKARRCATVCAT